MRDFSFGVAPLASVFSLMMLAAANAVAQTPVAPGAAPAPTPAPPPPAVAPAAPPPAQAAPAPAPAAAPVPYTYAPPPPGYAYAYPAPAYAAPAPRRPETLPYTGGPVPAGWHVEERTRRGLIIGGSLTLGVPWALGIAFASGSNFPNQTGWLVVPALGPWLTLATRKNDTSCYASLNGSNSCVEEIDNGYKTLLVLDGFVQAAGAFMLIYGMASPKQVLVRDFVGSLHFTPARMGKYGGYGAVLSGEF